MSSSYTKAAFGLTVTRVEADMLRRVITAVDLIAQIDVSIEMLEERYTELGADFAARFPRTELNPFDGLLELFADINYVEFGFDFDIGKPDADGQVAVFLSGEQFELETAANLLQRCAKSALPFGFEWSSDHDRLRTGESGGGYVVITETDIEFANTGRMLDRALARAGDEGADGLVLAIRDPEHGLSFWNDTDVFGRLARARVFSEAEADAFNAPIPDYSLEWLAMPAPLRV